MTSTSVLKPLRRPRVALVGPTPKDIGGISTHMDHLLGSTLVDCVELLHFEAGNNGLPESRLQILCRLTVSPLSFFRFLIARRPDIAHVNSTMVPKALARDAVYVLIARLLGCRVIYQVHGGALPQYLSSRSALLKRLLAWVLSASAVIVLLARVEMDAYRSFLPGIRLELIPNAIDTDSMRRNALAGVRAETLHLAYVGRLIAEKGIFEAVEAIAILARQKHEVMLSIAGSGPREDELRARVADLQLDDRVHFLGRLFDGRKEALWQSAHIFVFPTFFLEGLPYALLEAMAVGAVPITTRAGAIPDVVEDGVHGVFVPAREPAALAAAIARLDDDRTTLARMAEASRRRVVERYTLTRLADDFQRLYRSVLKGSCAGP